MSSQESLKRRLSISDLRPYERGMFNRREPAENWSNAETQMHKGNAKTAMYQSNTGQYRIETGWGDRKNGLADRIYNSAGAKL